MVPPPRHPRTIATIGVGRRDATPAEGIFSGIWGASTWERSSGIHRPLTLTALHLSGHGDRALLLLVLDGTAWRRPEDEWRLRSAIVDATGLAIESVVVQLTHTHSTPSLCPEDRDRGGGELIEPYLDYLRDQAVEAAIEAVSSARPGRIDWGRGSSRLASIRDLPAVNRYLTGWNPDAVADDTVLVGRIDVSGRTIATIVNYACHPTTLAWENSLISPDYVGAMREVVELATDAPCIFLQGAEGDTAPREQYSGDVALAERHGRGLGLAVLSALDLLSSPETGDPTPLAAATATSRLPLKPVEGIAELARRFWPDLDSRTRESRVRRAEWRRRQAGTAESADFPIWVWRLGDAYLVAQPGEAYNQFQLELRRRHPGVPILVLSLANGPIWTYFPTADRFAHNVYQVWHTPFEKGGHEAIVEVADELLTAAGA